MGYIFYVVADEDDRVFGQDNAPMMFGSIKEATEWLASADGKISCERFGFRNPSVKAVSVTKVGW